MTHPVTVLIIDDTPDIVKVLGQLLQHWGYRVLTAHSGEEGLAVAEAHHPDLILLDILMPRMKGRDVCARLKALPELRETPVIFLTALGLLDHVKQGLALGADDYIVKPFKSAELKMRMERCLAQATGRAAR